MKEIVSYLDKFVILIPVYYEHEDSPALRKVFTGTKLECENMFDSLPDHMRATHEENKRNREWKAKEYLLLMSTGRKKKAIEIKHQYGF